MVATGALFLEYEAVLTRPEHLAKAGITVAEADSPNGMLAHENCRMRVMQQITGEMRQL